MSFETKKNAIAGRKMGILLIGMVTAAGMLVARSLTVSGSRERQSPAFSSAMRIEAVQKARFVQSVTAKGEIRMYQPTVVYNDCRYWPRTIVELVPEGSIVKEGEVLCVLDSSEIREKLQAETLLLIKAKAGYANAVAMETLQEIRNARRLSSNSILAETSLDRFTSFQEAESSQELLKLQNDVRLRRESMILAEEEYHRIRDLSKQGFSSRTELEIRRTEFLSAERSMSIADGLLNLTKTFQHVRKLVELETNSGFARDELRRTELQNDLASTIQRVKSQEMLQWVTSVQLRVDYLTRAMNACTIRAPRAGELVYCHKRDEGKLIEVDGTAHYTQELFWIGDRTRMVVAGRVSDRRVYQLRENLPVDIRVPTLPDREYTGQLVWIAPIPSPASWLVPHELLHDIQIELEGDAESLSRIALGATATCDILVEDREDVLQIPVRAVFRRNHGYAVIVRKGSQDACQQIRLGNSNDMMVEVLAGVNAGDEVIIDDQYILMEVAGKLHTGDEGT